MTTEIPRGEYDDIDESPAWVAAARLRDVEAQLDLTRKARDRWKQLCREKSSLLREARGSNAYLTARVERADNATSDALDRAEKAEATIERVRALADRATACLSIPPADCTDNCGVGPCDCSGVFRARAWDVSPDALRAILDGSGDEPGAVTGGV